MGTRRNVAQRAPRCKPVTAPCEAIYSAASTGKEGHVLGSNSCQCHQDGSDWVIAFFFFFFPLQRSCWHSNCSLGSSFLFSLLMLVRVIWNGSSDPNRMHPAAGGRAIGDGAAPRGNRQGAEAAQDKRKMKNGRERELNFNSLIPLHVWRLISKAEDQTTGQEITSVRTSPSKIDTPKHSSCTYTQVPPCSLGAILPAWIFLLTSRRLCHQKTLHLTETCQSWAHSVHYRNGSFCVCCNFNLFLLLKTVNRNNLLTNKLRIPAHFRLWLFCPWWDDNNCLSWTYFIIIIFNYICFGEKEDISSWWVSLVWQNAHTVTQHACYHSFLTLRAVSTTISFSTKKVISSNS